MAITKLVRSSTRRESWQQVLKSDGSKETTGTIWYLIQFNNLSSTPLNCFAASFGGLTIPSVGDTLGTLYCTRVTPQQTESPDIFEIQVEWSDSVPPTAQPTTGTKWGVDLSFDADTIAENAEYDNFGFPVVNSANQAFDPPIPRIYYEEEITVVFNTTTIDESTVVACRGKINNAPVTLSVNGYTRLFETGTLKLIKAPFTTSTTAGNRYFRQQYVFRYRPRVTFDDGDYSGWTSHVVDRGFYEYDDDGTGHVEIHDKHGQPKNAPSNLDGNGYALDANEDVTFFHYNINDADANFAPLFSGL